MQTSLLLLLINYITKTIIFGLISTIFYSSLLYVMIVTLIYISSIYQYKY